MAPYMKNLIIISAFTSMMSAALVAQAEQSATLSVSGKISPPSCDIKLTGTDAFDLGEIDRHKLTATFNALPNTKSAKLAISCLHAKTSVELKFTDTYRAQLLASTHLNSYPDSGNPESAFERVALFGLSNTKGKAVGSYFITLSNVKVDNIAAKFQTRSSIFGLNMPHTASPVAPGAFILPGQQFTFGQQFTSDIHIEPTLEKYSAMDDTVNIAGETVITLLYP